MDSNDFREFGKAMIDYIADYLDNIRNRDVIPSVKPGYIQDLIPKDAPVQPEHWKDVLQDVEKVIMPGTTHWNSPSFHAYYPTANSYPALVAEMLSSGIGCIGFTWMSSPACTELEVMMMNWLGKLIGLPEHFLNSSEGPGGGVIQGSASEATLVGLLAARDRMVKRTLKQNPELSEAEIRGKLIAYTSNQANSSVEKAGLLASVPMIHLPTENYRLTGKILREAIQRDRENGLIPCYVVATLGTTGSCAFDKLEELGIVCNEENIWLHVDAAYAGSAFVCPEYRYLMKGVELCDSFNMNPHKWMLVNFDCSAMWIKNARYLIEAFSVDRIYLQHQFEGHAPDYRHWQIPLGRRFRSLKLWFVLRIYGAEGIQKHIRSQIALAKHFEQIVNSDSRFEVCNSIMGLVCFRLRGPDQLTQTLVDKITANKKVYVIPCHFQDKLVIRFAVCSRLTNVDDVNNSWKEITSHVGDVPSLEKVCTNGYGISKQESYKNEVITKSEGFQSENPTSILIEKTK